MEGVLAERATTSQDGGAEQVLLEAVAVEKVSTRDGRAAAQVVASQVVPAGTRMVVGAVDRCVAVWREQG